MEREPAPTTTVGSQHADDVRLAARLGAIATRLENLLKNHAETAAHNLSVELWECQGIRTDEDEIRESLLRIVTARFLAEVGE